MTVFAPIVLSNLVELWLCTIYLLPSVRGSRGSSKPRFVSKRISFFGNVNCLSNFRGSTPAGRNENANTCEALVVLLKHTYSRANNLHVHTKA